MSLFLDDIEFLEALWESAFKGDDNCIHYTEKDVELLWNSGFVDTKNIKLNQWKDLMSQFRQDDGTYILDHDQFMSLDAYRYKGEIKIPFDAMMINEGKYTDKGFEELARDSIAPSCEFTPPELAKFIEKLKDDNRQPDGLIKIDRNTKATIKMLLDEHPSPLRRYELMLDYIFSLAEDYLDREGMDIKTIAQHAQKSMFSSKPLTAAEQKSHDLKNLTKSKKKKEDKPSKDKSGKTLGKLKRSKRGIRG